MIEKRFIITTDAEISASELMNVIIDMNAEFIGKTVIIEDVNDE